jgi:hypothetical protein
MDSEKLIQLIEIQNELLIILFDEHKRTKRPLDEEVKVIHLIEKLKSHQKSLVL